MQKYRSIILLSILILNMSILSFEVLTNGCNHPISRPIQGLKGKSAYIQRNIETLPASPINEYLSNSLFENHPQYSLHAVGNTLLNTTIDDESPTPEFINNIWNDTLGSDNLVVDYPSQYENGTIYNAENGLTSKALFVRIGNKGYNEDTLNESLDADIIDGISAGWRINFNVGSAYEVINVSFKWRYDAPDNAFDNYTELVPGVVLDDSSDFQEIRCRIKHPINDEKSFWMGNPVTTRNPNGTVFYRIGPTIEADEEWFEFKGSFYVSETGNYILELGAYLNTREYWNEYFDVWFDDIVIEGFTDVDDTHAPIPISTGIDRTTNVSRYKFWVSLSEGLWESPIENVTVFYNLTRETTIITNDTLQYVPPNTISVSGYNQTYWRNYLSVSFNDQINYKFSVFDRDNNSYTTGVRSVTIGDNSAPEIISSTDTAQMAFVNHLGNGTTIISINATDWGFGIGSVILNYTLDSNPSKTVPMSKVYDFQLDEINYTHYEARLNVSYASRLRFRIILNDTASPSNSITYPTKAGNIYETNALIDIIPPVIQNITINPSQTLEARTIVKIVANDTFGLIDEVYLRVKYVGNDSYHLKYGRKKLQNSTGYWVLPSSVETPGGALILPFTENYENYSLTFFVRDEAGLTVNQTVYYIVNDIVAPKVSIFDFDYSIPGILKVWVQAIDEGSGLSYLSLERKTDAGWTSEIPLKISNRPKMYFAEIATNWIGNELIELRINARDNLNNSLDEENKNLTMKTYITQYFITTGLGLLISELLVVFFVLFVFMAIKISNRRRFLARRRVRFDIALGRSEKLAYLGEEAIFGFIAAFGQREGTSSALVWEPRLISPFYPYLKELIEKANNTMSFVLQTRTRDQISFIDFRIEEIGCSAFAFAYPVSTLPQQWLSILTLDHVPMGGGQDVLLLMLLMREQWTEVANSFKEEITDGMLEIKNLFISGADKQTIIEKAREFRLFISGTIEVMDEIDIEADEISDEIMSEFEAEFLGSEDDSS